MPRLAIRLLGSFSLEYGGTELKGLHTARLQALITYLLLHREAPQSRQQIAFLFWPDTTDAQAQTNLRQLLHTLRSRLPDAGSYLDITDKTVRWRSEGATSLDVLDFEAGLAASQGEGSDAIAALERGIAAYGGDLLPGCYDEWLLVERARLLQAFLDALERLVILLEQRRDYPAAIAYAERLLRNDPLHEATYRRLMRLHALNGERGAALRVYHTCVSTLERELGVPPGTATRDTYEQLLDLERRGALAPASPAAAPLVGRQGEWQVLQERWRLVRRGSSQFVCLAGEPGIGKTRLAEELLHWAQQQGITTAATRAYAEGGSLAYAPVVDLLRGEALQPSLKRLAAVWRTELARLLPELLDEDPRLPRPEPLTERLQVQRLYDAIDRVILEAGGPLLLLFDDLQWFDGDSIAWLHFLLRPDGHGAVRGRAPAHLLVLATLRPEEIDEDHPVARLLLDLRRRDRLTELALAPLSAVETAELAAQAADHPLAAAAAAAIHRVTEGNPLFIVETVRSSLPATFDLAALPSTSLAPRVHAVIRARLAQLSAAARDLAGLAAATGRSFAYEVLALASDQDEDTVVHSLDELWRRRIVREQRGNAYDFSHDLLRDVAYGELSAARRRLVHARLAKALETLYAHDTTQVSAQLAHHYEHAGRPELAVRYLLVAAASAAGVFAHQEVIALLTHALSLLRSLPPSGATIELELDLQLALGTSWAAMTDYLGEEVAVAYHRALELCRQVPHAPHLYTALWGLHEVALYRGDLAESLDLARQCLQIAGELDEPGLWVEAHHAAWGPYFFMGEYDKAIWHMEQGLALYDAKAHEVLSIHYGAHDAASCALTLMAMGQISLGRFDQARRTVAAALTHGQQLLYVFNLADLYGHVALSLHLLHDPQQARLVATMAVQVSRDIASRLAETLGEAVLGWSLALQGQAAEGISLIEKALSESVLYGERLRHSHFSAMLAEAYVSTGAYQDAIRVADESIREFQRTRNVLCAPDLWTLKGDALRALGAPDAQAEECYQAALALAGELSATVSELRAAVGLARLRQQQGRHGEGFELLAGVYERFTEGFDSYDLTTAAQVLDELRALR